MHVMDKIQNDYAEWKKPDISPALQKERVWPIDFNLNNALENAR